MKRLTIVVTHCTSTYLYVLIENRKYVQLHYI